MNAPLYHALSHLAHTQPLRLHMPGHKGRLSGAFSHYASLDFTEIAPTGNLYTGEGPIAQAEALYAQSAHGRDALFFSCGSTQGIQTMLLAAAGVGSTVILDRGCHKSVYNTMALLDITPVYLLPDLLPGTSLPGPISPALLEQTLTEHPEARAVVVTTPSYYGVITDLKPLAALCHRFGVYLLVDQAHGAHFPFLGLPSAPEEGADLCVVSTHKTLPALGSSAVLLTGAQAPWTALELKQMSSIFSTTSPSYPILASIDYARALLEGEAGADYRHMAALVSAMRRRISQETLFSVLTQCPGLSLDPCRLTIDTASAGLSGHQADLLLQKQNVYVEMSDERYLVCILTCCDREQDLDRLFSALCSLPQRPASHCLDFLPPPLPSRPMSIRGALFGPKEFLPLSQAAGRISAQILAPYPPGIPVVAPGEEITEKHIAYLQKKSYNIEECIGVNCESPIL